MKLEREFYQRNSVTVAKALLGCVLISDIVRLPSDERTARIIVETEAYGGEKDPSSHAFKGKTARTEVMYGKPGKAYVYLIYGIHHLLNVVTENPGAPGAVLIRALHPIKGIDTMKQRRATDTLLELTNGPGKLARALGITVAHNGLDMTEDTVWIEPFLSVVTIHTSSRIGVTDELPLRFFTEDEFISI